MLSVRITKLKPESLKITSAKKHAPVSFCIDVSHGKVTVTKVIRARSSGIHQ